MVTKMADEKRSCKKCGEQKIRSESGRWRCKTCEREYQRENYHKNIEKNRERKKLAMRRYRADPEKREQILESQRKSWRKNGVQTKQKYMDKIRETDIWKWKKITTHNIYRGDLSAEDLKSIFDKQKGLCGISGRPLDIEKMHLDHIIPRSKGGQNTIENLRWACKEANEAKGNLMDDDFILLCNDVIHKLGSQSILEDL